MQRVHAWCYLFSLSIAYQVTFSFSQAQLYIFDLIVIEKCTRMTDKHMISAHFRKLYFILVYYTNTDLQYYKVFWCCFSPWLQQYSGCTILLKKMNFKSIHTWPRMKSLITLEYISERSSKINKLEEKNRGSKITAVQNCSSPCTCSFNAYITVSGI
jgi:hypothetical protein